MLFLRDGNSQGLGEEHPLPETAVRSPAGKHEHKCEGDLRGGGVYVLCVIFRSDFAISGGHASLHFAATSVDMDGLHLLFPRETHLGGDRRHRHRRPLRQTHRAALGRPGNDDVLCNRQPRGRFYLHALLHVSLHLRQRPRSHLSHSDLRSRWLHCW